MIVYHATNKEFSEFKNKYMDSNNTCQMLGHGFYFSSDIQGAEQYGNILLKCKIPDFDFGYFNKYSDDEAPIELIEHMIKYAPDLKETLSDFGDVNFEEYEAVFNKAIEAYKGLTCFQLCNVLSNDFYKHNPLEFNLRFKEYTNHIGLNDCNNYCILDSRDIEILEVMY